jgi:hypothetical protein
LFVCVQVVDAYLQACKDTSKEKLYLIGLVALYLSYKYERNGLLLIKDFLKMSKSEHAKKEVTLMESNILNTIEFRFGKPLPINFLRRFSKAAEATELQHTLAKYFIELSLHDAEFASMDPSYLAASSLCLSFKILKAAEWVCIHFFTVRIFLTLILTY